MARHLQNHVQCLKQMLVMQIPAVEILGMTMMVVREVLLLWKCRNKAFRGNKLKKECKTAIEWPEHRCL